MSSIDPAHTIASGHVVAAADGSEDGNSHSTAPPQTMASSAASSTAAQAAHSGSAAAPSASPSISFSLSIPTSEASLSFSALSTLAGDDANEEGPGTHTSAKREDSAEASGSKAADSADASALGPAPLRRNQACLSCRKRKLRCDAARPVCATCARSRAAAAAANHAAPVPPGDCIYDDISAGTRRHTDASRPRASDAKSTGGAPRKSGGTVSSGSGPAPAAAPAISTSSPAQARFGDDKVAAMPIGASVLLPAPPETGADSFASFPAPGTSPESSMSATSSAPRAQKRKKRDDGTAQGTDGDSILPAVHTQSSLAAAASIGPMPSVLTNGSGSASGPATGDLERRMREFQLEDRIHHLEMLLVQSMNRNEHMQAQFNQMQTGQSSNTSQHFSAQSTSAFNAATLASAGIPSAACTFSNAPAAPTPASNSVALQSGTHAMTMNPSTGAFGAANALAAPATMTASQVDKFGPLLSPSNGNGTYPLFSGQDVVASSAMNLATSGASASLANNAFAGSSDTSLPGGLPTGLHPNAMSILNTNRVAEEINNNTLGGQDAGGGQQPDPFLELLWPGWPKDLPSPDTVHHLAEIFFAKCPLRGMIHKGQFMSGLLLPPRHHLRPHDALLHAVLAVAAPMSPHFKSKRSNPLAAGVASPSGRMAGNFSDPECVVPMVGDPQRRQQQLDPSKLSFADFHLSQARLKIEASMKTSTRNPIHWLQASILGAYALWADGRFVEGFMLSGVLSRAAAPVGLFKLQSRHAAEPQIPASLLAPPSSATEEHERRTLMWYIYLNDVYQSGAGLYWEPSISDEAVQTSFPVPMMQWQAGLDPPPNHQTLSSPDLFTSNHMDDFVLHVKSAVILKRVQTYISRNNITMFTTKRPAGYRALDNTINDFLASFTGSHHLEFGPNVTMDRLLAYNNVLLATILLHENFVSLSDRTSYSNVRTEQATKAVLQTIYELLATSFDFNLLHPYIYMAWTIAARMICRELTWQRIFGDAKVAMEVSQALDTVIEALRRGGEKHLVAARSALLLDRFRQGHWSEEMLSGSIFIDGVLPGEEDDDGGAADHRGMGTAKVTAPTKPGQPVHYYPLKGSGGTTGSTSSGGALAGLEQASPGTVDDGGSTVGNSNNNSAGGLNVAQVVAAFTDWMASSETNDALRSSADPFLPGRSTTAGAVGSAGVASGMGLAAGSSGVPSPESVLRPMTSASNSTHSGGGGGGGGGAMILGAGLDSSGHSPAGQSNIQEHHHHHAGSLAGGAGMMAMQMSPAPTEANPSTPWSFTNILAPEQEGLD